MARVLLEYVIRPESPEVKIEELEEELYQIANELDIEIERMSREDFMFGMQQIRLSVSIPEDNPDLQERFEEHLEKSEKIGSYELTYTTRL